MSNLLEAIEIKLFYINYFNVEYPNHFEKKSLYTRNVHTEFTSYNRLFVSNDFKKYDNLKRFRSNFDLYDYKYMHGIYSTVNNFVLIDYFCPNKTFLVRKFLKVENPYWTNEILSNVNTPLHRKVSHFTKHNIFRDRLDLLELPLYVENKDKIEIDRNINSRILELSIISASLLTSIILITK